MTTFPEARTFFKLPGRCNGAYVNSIGSRTTSPAAYFDRANPTEAVEYQLGGSAAGGVPGRALASGAHLDNDRRSKRRSLQIAIARRARPTRPAKARSDRGRGGRCSAQA